MNLKKFMLACIAGLTGLSVMAAPLALDTTNSFIGAASTLLKNSASDISGWQYNGVDLISSMDDASAIKSSTALDLNTSGGELKQVFASAPLTIPTVGAYEYSVDTTFQFTKDWPTTLLGDLATNSVKTAIFAMAANPDDDSQGAKLIVAQGGAYADSGISPDAGFAYVDLPAPLQTGTSYRVTIRVKGVTDTVVSPTKTGYPVTLVKVLVNGQEYAVRKYDNANPLATGALIGFSGTESDLTVMGTGAGSWLMAACYNADYTGLLVSADAINSVSFQGTGTLDNMALATYSDPILASWTLAIVGTGTVLQGQTTILEGLINAGDYTVVPAAGYKVESIVGATSTNAVGFTLAAPVAVGTVTVTFVEKVAADTPGSADLADTALLPNSKDAWLAATSGKTAAFDAWVSAKSTESHPITFETMDGANAINAFLCNVSLNETTGLLAITEVTANGTTFTAKVFVGAIGVADGALLVNGAPVAYVGTTLGGLTSVGLTGVTIGAKDGNFVTITITMPAGTSGFVKFAIE